MIGMLYGKSLRLHASARNEYGTGAIVNLQSNDAQKLWWIPLFMHVLWSAPLQVREPVSGEKATGHTGFLQVYAPKHMTDASSAMAAVKIANKLCLSQEISLPLR